MKTIQIKLDQFSDFKTCSWVRGLVSLSSDFFNNKVVIADTLYLEFGPDEDYDSKLDFLSEASSVDFSYKIINGSLNEVKTVIHSVFKKR